MNGKYQINESHIGTGATPDDAVRIAEILTEAGYPSEYNSTHGVISSLPSEEDGERIQIPDMVWLKALAKL